MAGGPVGGRVEIGLPILAKRGGSNLLRAAISQEDIACATGISNGVNLEGPAHWTRFGVGLNRDIIALAVFGGKTEIVTRYGSGA